MAEGNSKKKRSTSGEEKQTSPLDDGQVVDTDTGEILDADFDVFDEAPDDDGAQGGGFGGDLQESYSDDYQDSGFEVSQIKRGKA